MYRARSKSWRLIRVQRQAIFDIKKKSGLDSRTNISKSKIAIAPKIHLVRAWQLFSAKLAKKLAEKVKMARKWTKCRTQNFQNFQSYFFAKNHFWTKKTKKKFFFWSEKKLRKISKFFEIFNFVGTFWERSVGDW